MRTNPDLGDRKRCSRCKKIKLKEGAFSRNKTRKDGYANQCKACHNISNTESYDRHKEVILPKKKVYRTKRYQTQEWKDYVAGRKEHKAELDRVYAHDNRDTIQPRKNAWLRDRYATDPAERVRRRVARLIQHNLKKGTKAGRTLKSLVGWTAQELKVHLESLFTDGMSWEAFMRGEIHIDHIIPVAVFNCPTPDHLDFKRCWALSNLQPLWAIDNMSKSDTLLEPFQPSLF